MFHRILIATDFSKASGAALYAGLGLAKKCLARVLSVHVASPFEMYSDSPQPLALHGSEWKTQIDQQFEEFFPLSIYPNSEKHVLIGHSAAGEILKMARMEQCNLIVIGNQGYGAVANALMGSVAQRITRESEIPVMVVRDVEHSVKKYQAYERILVTTDFSETSMKAVDLGVHFANFLKADLYLVHVVDLPAITMLTTGYPGYPLYEMRPAQQDKWQVDDTLQVMIVKQNLVGNLVTKTLHGDPVDEILRYATDSNINFLVMGTHGKKGLERLLLGSTTSAVIARSEIPVLTISDR